MAETSSLLNCRTGNRTTSSNLVASAVRVAKTYDGAIAQLVEQRTENPCVPGSIPGGTTKKKRGIATQQRVIPLFLFFPLSSFFLIYENVRHSICSSLSLLLSFSKLRIGHVRWINWLVASSFSVYLLHEEYVTRDHYGALANYIGDHYAKSVSLLLLMALVLGVYLATTLIEQVRKQAWKLLLVPVIGWIEGGFAARLKL